MAATGTKTRVSKAKSAKASVPVKSSSGSAAAKLIIAKATKLEQGHWDQLRQSGRLAVWKIAALSVGVAPVRGIRTLLEKSGQITLLKKLDDRRGIVRDNLTAKAESGGLQYVHDAVGDRQKSANTQNPFNLVVELVTFVNFAKTRGIELPKKMLKIAEAFDSPPSPAVEPPSQKGKSTKRNVDTTKRNELVIGLLALYLYKHAKDGTPPSTAILKGADKKLTRSGLASVIITDDLIKQRTDKKKNKAFGLSHVSVRHAITDGLLDMKERFGNIDWADDDATDTAAA